ncbi:hypothetical protein EDC04DRAFT_2608632 [Pisolithus marmoratus]|nr:hypothetical protein EDC04DRAFT_2608632 [Pisolithus marmoratus]
MKPYNQQVTMIRKLPTQSMLSVNARTEEVAEHARVVQAEAEHQEEEACEAWEMEEHEEEDQELNRWSKVPVVDRLGTSAPVLAESGASRRIESKGAGVECMFELVKATIDWHTSKMAKHWEITKETQCMQRQFNNHHYELLQETEYWQVVEVGESSDKESTGKGTSDGETNKDMEGEEAPESDPGTEGNTDETNQKMIHEVVMSGVLVLVASTGKQRGWHRGLEVPEEGNGGDMNRSFKYQKGTEVEGQGI